MVAEVEVRWRGRMRKRWFSAGVWHAGGERERMMDN